MRDFANQKPWLPGVRTLVRTFWSTTFHVLLWKSKASRLPMGSEARAALHIILFKGLLPRVCLSRVCDYPPAYRSDAGTVGLSGKASPQLLLPPDGDLHARTSSYLLSLLIASPAASAYYLAPIFSPFLLSRCAAGMLPGSDLSSPPEPLLC